MRWGVGRRGVGIRRRAEKARSLCALLLGERFGGIWGLFLYFWLSGGGGGGGGWCSGMGGGWCGGVGRLFFFVVVILALHFNVLLIIPAISPLPLALPLALTPVAMIPHQPTTPLNLCGRTPSSSHHSTRGTSGLFFS